MMKPNSIDLIILLCIAIFVVFACSISGKKIEKKSADKLNSNITYEQQMRFDEICAEYAKDGKFITMEQCLKEEGKWWKEVSLSCPPPKAPWLPLFKFCEELDRNRPLRMKSCDENGACYIISIVGLER